MPRELPDARDDLPKQAPRQVALGQLQDEVAAVSNQTPAGLEQPLLASPTGSALRACEEPQNPHFLRELSYYVLLHSPFKSKMWA